MVHAVQGDRRSDAARAARDTARITAELARRIARLSHCVSVA
jgi:hypothetical protein